MAGFSLATPPRECKPLPSKTRVLEGRDEKGGEGRRGRTDDEMDLGVASVLGFSNGTVGIGDGLLHVQPVQVDFAALTILVVLYAKHVVVSTHTQKTKTCAYSHVPT